MIRSLFLRRFVVVSKIVQDELSITSAIGQNKISYNCAINYCNYPFENYIIKYNY